MMVVRPVPTARDLFCDFDAYSTAIINSCDSQREAHRELWNRAHLNAIKIASIIAIAADFRNPVITEDMAVWATTLVAQQTHKLIAKFKNGEFGGEGGDEAKQMQAVMRCIKDYLHQPHNPKYHGSSEMHGKGVIALSYIIQKLNGVAVFKKDRIGGTNAINRTIKTLLEGDQLREIPTKQMIDLFGSKPRAFAVSDAKAIHNA